MCFGVYMYRLECVQAILQPRRGDLEGRQGERIMSRRKDLKRGRPIEKPIPDTPENIAKAMFRVGKKKEGEWRYLKDSK